MAPDKRIRFGIKPKRIFLYQKKNPVRKTIKSRFPKTKQKHWCYKENKSPKITIKIIITSIEIIINLIKIEIIMERDLEEDH